MNEDTLKGFIATTGTCFTYIFGKWDMALIVLIAFIALDYITGIIKAFLNKEVSSNIGFHGLAKKSLIFIVLIVSVLLDRLLNDESWIFRTLICYFYIANEGISILENCCILGLPIPKVIQDVLVQLKEGKKDNSSKNVKDLHK